MNNFLCFIIHVVCKFDYILSLMIHCISLHASKHIFVLQLQNLGARILNGNKHLTHLTTSGGFWCWDTVLLLSVHWSLFITALIICRGFVFGPCFVMQYLSSS